MLEILHYLLRQLRQHRFGQSFFCCLWSPGGEKKEKRRRRIKERKLGDELELCPRAVIAGGRREP